MSREEGYGGGNGGDSSDWGDTHPEAECTTPRCRLWGGVRGVMKSAPASSERVRLTAEHHDQNYLNMIAAEAKSRGISLPKPSRIEDPNILEGFFSKVNRQSVKAKR